MKIERGFTLVEILVVIAVIAITGTIMVAIFTNTLRGSNKAQVFANIKQNGQAVLERMDKEIREADDVICPKLPPFDKGRTLVIFTNGCFTRYRFIDPSPSPNPTKNGQIQQDNPHYDPSAPCVQNSPPPTPPPTPTPIADFYITVCADTDPMVSPNILTDTNPQSGVSVRSGLFTRNTEPGYKDSVTVSFILGAGADAPSVVAGQIDPVTFQTSVQLR